MKTASLQINTTFGKLIISPDELKDLHFFDIPLRSNKGNVISEQSMITFIQAATATMEIALDTKLIPEYIEEETQDFIWNEFSKNGFIRCNFPIAKPLSLSGRLQGWAQDITYQVDWLSVRKEKGNSKNLFIMPGYNMPLNNVLQFPGLMTLLPYYRGYDYVPNYWRISYIAGMSEVPEAIIYTISKLAAIPVFYQLADVVLMPGITGQTLSVDGLSQNINAAGAFKDRIANYLQSIKDEIELYQSMYRGIQFTVL